MFPRLRTIIESEDYGRQCAELQPDIRRLDEQLEAVVWAVARDPTIFTRVVGSVYVIETFALGSDDEYAFIFFTIDNDETCTLRWIERSSSVTTDHVAVDPLAPLV